jgi:hypothetical protein
MMMPDAVGAAPELVRRREEIEVVGGGGRPAELHRTCLAVLRAEWSTLAVVSFGARARAVELANALEDAARVCRLAPVRALNGCEGPSSAPGTLLEALQASRGAGARTAVALDDLSADPARLPVLLAADAALLVVRLGDATTRAVEAALELVGRDRVVGCVVVPR